jgi:uncharacterized SAM-binding protein YcdF (DUF218 family)
VPREITDIVAQLILPPAGPLLLLALGALLALRRWRATGIALGVLAFAALWISSLGVVGDHLLRTLEAPPAAEAALATAKAVVVLGAGRIQDSPEYAGDTVGAEGLVRLRYGARLARKLGLPLLVAGGKPYGGRLSEGRTMAAALEEDFKTPARWMEEESTTTAENAAHAFAILRPEERTRIALVTSAWHMRRAKLAFAKAGFDVVPAPTGYASRGELRLLDWIPSAAGLYATRTALWELLGMAWYRLTGAA